MDAWSVRVGTGVLMLLAIAPSHAARFHRSRVSPSQHASGVSQRKRLHINDLIAEPGTVELDLGGLYSRTTRLFTLPSALKFTPAGGSLLWGRTEYSVAFDSVASAVHTGVRSTQFSDRLTFAATSVVFDSPHFDFAFGPQITAFLRGESGTRLGAMAVARYDGRGNSLGFTAGWSAASSATDTNPSGVWDFGAGYGRRLASSGIRARFTPHVNAVLEKSTGFQPAAALFGGIECHLSEHTALDASVQRYGLTGGSPDRQFLLGLTINLGRTR